MSKEAKPKIEGAKKFRWPMRAAGQLTKKELITKVLGLESHTLDIGNAKYAAKNKKTVNAIASGADIAKAVKDLSLPTLQVPEYPTAKAGETVVDPGDVYIWQQDVATVKKQTVQLEENKKRAHCFCVGTVCAIRQHLKN